MRWPWTSRETLEAANEFALALKDRALKAEAQAILLETREANRTEAHDQAIRIMQHQLDAAREDNKLLIDRIAQMSGQPPIFYPLPVNPILAQPEPQTSKIAAPETRASFADVKRAARKAIDKGDLNILSTGVTS